MRIVLRGGMIMPYINQRIFSINRKRYEEVRKKLRSLEKRFKKIEKENDKELIVALLDETKKFKNELRNFSYEFKGFLDTIRFVKANLQEEYEEMFNNIIESYIDTTMLIKKIKGLNDGYVNIVKPIKIIRKA